MDVRLKDKYWVKNETSIRIWYMAGDAIRNIHLADPLEVAIFLKKHRIIEYYTANMESGNCLSVGMYTTSLQARTDRVTGEIVWKECPCEFTWDDIEITPERAYDIARINEYEIATKAMGNPITEFVNWVTSKITAA